MFVATKTHQMQRMNFAMQQAHELSQQKLSCRKRSFSVATSMPIRNQIIYRGNKHTSIATINPNYRNAQLVVAIGTHKGNHLFYSSIDTNLLQRMLHQTQPALLVAIRSRYRNPLICWLLQDQILQPNVWCCKTKWCSKGQFLVVLFYAMALVYHCKLWTHQWFEPH
jgi:hypothetical protein